MVLPTGFDNKYRDNYEKLLEKRKLDNPEKNIPYKIGSFFNRSKPLTRLKYSLCFIAVWLVYIGSTETKIFHRIIDNDYSFITLIALVLFFNFVIGNLIERRLVDMGWERNNSRFFSNFISLRSGYMFLSSGFFFAYAASIFYETFFLLGILTLVIAIPLFVLSIAIMFLSKNSINQKHSSARKERKKLKREHKRLASEIKEKNKNLKLQNEIAKMKKEIKNLD